MNWIINPNTLHILNLVLLGGIIAYLTTKVTRHKNVIFIQISLVPLLAVEIGAYLFEQSHTPFAGALLIITAIILTPVTIVPLSHLMGRKELGDGNLSGLYFMPYKSRFSCSFSARLQQAALSNG
jgi:hypothetical protein